MPSDIVIEKRVNRNFSLGLFRRLWDALAAALLQADVNHVTGDVHYLTYFLDRRRTVLTMLDCVALERSRGLRFWLLWFFWYWLPEKRCAVIPVISEATRQQVLRYLKCDPEKVQVIHCNVSDEFQPTPKQFDSDCPRILHVGTTSHKNLERHAAALEGIKCQLVVIGQISLSQTTALQQHGINYQNLTRLTREEIVAEYQRCDLLLFASTYEGFGLPIVEAQAVGRAVITSDLWSIPEVAGSGACFVDPFDITSIRSGLERVLNDVAYRDTLISHGLENVDRFRTTNIAKQYADLYRQVARNARNNS
ncbi:MAG: glycosyltransferase family 4 protein [Chromatiaceae bacterium]|nr:glycosyltransferase family 4 protein [Chromatiaceae bacterium]